MANTRTCRIKSLGSMVSDQYCTQFWLHEKDLNCMVIAVAFSYCSGYLYRGVGVYRTSLRTHTDTPTLPARFGSPPSNRELRVRRVSANRKAAIEGKKESRISSKGWTVLQRFRERRNRYARAHNTPTQQLNNAATCLFLLPLWPLWSLHAVCVEF